jgi:hypothetical protein
MQGSQLASSLASLSLRPFAEATSITSRFWWGHACSSSHGIKRKNIWLPLGFVCLHYLQAAKVKILMQIVSASGFRCTANSSTNTHVWHFPSQKQIPLAQGTYHPGPSIKPSPARCSYALFCFVYATSTPAIYVSQ